MFHKKILMLTTGAVLLFALASCTENVPPPAAAGRPAPPPLTTEPIGLQMTRAEPRLAGTPFRVLLDFERPTDMAFLLSPIPADAPHLSGERAHTGVSALMFDRGGTVDVKLASLHSGGPFPGAWTLAGAYFSNAGALPASVTIAYRAGASAQPLLQRTVEIPPGATWTPVFIDLTTLPAGASAEVGLLNIQVVASQSVYCDDVVLINNAKTLEEPAAGSPPLAGWTIRQGGCAIDVVRPARFRVTLKTPEAVPDGWSNEEANDLRARFVSATGKSWTIYADGRQYQDGQFSSLTPLGDAAVIYAQQHGSPAELSVPEEFGRIDRDTPGDKNNDGYNETRGSYQLIAKGPRFEVTLKPTTRLLAHPVLEISGLPAGNALTTVEGQLIEKTTRMPNGNLLLEIPLVLERATTISIAIK
ncbi:MAG: hypothetical protein JWN40_5074 [Phycisphaerales bacterium]|nr:hypothetical protein [Phycisphaerales bacterium]